MSRPRMWRIISPARPGVFDGIGDFSGLLADALQPFHPTALVVRRARWDELESVAIDETAAVIVQYVPQAYMHGDLRALLRWVGRVRATGAPVVLVVHEYWPPQDGTLRRTAVRWLFRRMLRACMRRSDALVTSQEFSAGELSSFARRTVHAIPVGSSVPCVTPRAPEPGRHLVLFGQPAALHAPTMRALGAWLGTTPDVSLTWLGRSSEEMQAAWHGQWGLSAARVRFAGGLPAADVSAVLNRSTLALAPYENGASTRRTTFAAFMQHALPTVAVDGLYTSDWLRAADACVWTPEGEPAAFVAGVATLLGDAAEQSRLSARAAALHAERLSWPVIGAAYARLLMEGVSR